MDLERAQVQQPSDNKWNNWSDHTPIVYKVKDVNIKRVKIRVSKPMLTKMRNREEAGECYRENILELTKKVKHATEAELREIFKEIAGTITKPWKSMIDRRPEARSPH